MPLYQLLQVRIVATTDNSRNWYLTIHEGCFTADEVLFAGDGGNDREVFQSGLKCILVSNTPTYLVEAATSYAKSEGFLDQLYLAQNEATIGLVEGCSKFGWL